ncbi:POGK [Branchiostoma lanceolatum]|uniref:POGK protein n=1 Tax=Branchiostoma lanceolatum TaxID=7740 RepID=A0A8J9YVC6_BRALA|nr:POGK [Branchiostoma lanceolatum]
MAVIAFREMMACMDLVVPSASCLQTLANKYSDIIEEENENNMKRWREVVKTISELQGNEPGSPIRAQVDTRYQTQIGHLRGRKPGQPSPHSNAILAEEVTTRGKIIANYLRNKNCGMCKWWNAYGFEAPPHKCTANISEQAVIGDEEEALWYMAGGSQYTWPVLVCRKTSMFPGKTSIVRDRVKTRVANDLVQRLNAEHGKAFEKIGMLRKCAMERAMDKAMQALPSCYAGDHSSTSSARSPSRSPPRHKSSTRQTSVRPKSNKSTIHDESSRRASSCSHRDRVLSFERTFPIPFPYPLQVADQTNKIAAEIQQDYLPSGSPGVGHGEAQIQLTNTAPIIDLKKRLDKDTYQMLYRPGDHIILPWLRSIKKKGYKERRSYIRNQVMGNRIVDMQKMEELIYLFNAGHRKANGIRVCKGDCKFSSKLEKKIGFGCKEALLCKACGYKTTPTELFQRADTRRPGTRDPLPVKLNIQAVTPGAKDRNGCTAIKPLFASMNIQGPSRTTLQKKLNVANAGLKERRTVTEESDVAYNNPPKGRSMGQPGTQAECPFFEAETGKKMLVSIRHKTTAMTTSATYSASSTVSRHDELSSPTSATWSNMPGPSTVDLETEQDDDSGYDTEDWENADVAQAQRDDIIEDTIERHKKRTTSTTEYKTEEEKEVYVIAQPQSWLLDRPADLSRHGPGRTSALQPLDVGVNKVLKDRMKRKWNAWMVDRPHEYTKMGNRRLPSKNQILSWLAEAWGDVKRSFRKAGISLSMDGTEDDAIYQSDNDLETDSESEDHSDSESETEASFLRICPKNTNGAAQRSRRWRPVDRSQQQGVQWAFGNVETPEDRLDGLDIKFEDWQPKGMLPEVGVAVEWQQEDIMQGVSQEAFVSSPASAGEIISRALRWAN